MTHTHTHTRARCTRYVRHAPEPISTRMRPQTCPHARSYSLRAIQRGWCAAVSSWSIWERTIVPSRTPLSPRWCGLWRPACVRPAARRRSVSVSTSLVGVSPCDPSSLPPTCYDPAWVAGEAAGSGRVLFMPMYTFRSHSEAVLHGLVPIHSVTR